MKVTFFEVSSKKGSKMDYLKKMINFYTKLFNKASIGANVISEDDITKNKGICTKAKNSKESGVFMMRIMEHLGRDEEKLEFNSKYEDYYRAVVGMHLVRGSFDDV
jgi:hypothetical protein